METRNLGCCSITVKYLVFLFNLIFFACGLGLIIIGAVVQGFFAEYVQFFENKYETPAIGIIILGLIILVIAFFGCCGASKENVCMLNSFAGLLGVVIICEIAAGITVAVLRNEVKTAAHSHMLETMEQYGQEEKLRTKLVTDSWDNLQEDYMCCGVDSFRDWFNSTDYKKIPSSCCIQQSTDCATGIDINTPDDEAATKIFTEGCFESLQNAALKSLAAITGACVAVMLVQCIGIWMACGLVKAVRERYEVL